MSTVGSGEQQEFSVLFRSFAPSVRGFVSTLVQPADVEPVVGATFETAWQKLDQIPLLSQRAWLFGVARNHVRNMIRAERRRQVLVDALLVLRPTEESGLFADRVSPDELEPVVSALRLLSDDDRELLQLSIWNELSPTEIAVVLGITANSARVRLHRARTRLMQHVRTQEVEG